jgi:polysaccharide biosynthesis transport protein
MTKSTALTPYKQPATPAPLDDRKRIVYFEPLETPAAAVADGPSAFVDTARLLRSGIGRVLAAVILCAALGAAITFVQNPIYQARATIEIHAPNETVFGMQGGVGTTAAPESFLQTQVKALESRTLQKRVIETLRHNGKLSTYTPPDRLAAWAKALGVVRRTAVAGPVTPSVPVHEVKVKAFENTQLVEILCDSPDPNFSADYANTMSDEFTQLSLESRWAGYQHTSDWMTRQLSDMKGKLEESERELQAYSASSGLLFTDDKDSVQSVKLKQIQEELSKAQADRTTKQALYEVASASAANAVPQVIDNERLSGYQTKLTELRREAAELSALYTAEHYKVIRVKAQIAELESTFQRERDAILMRIRNDFQAAQKRENLLLIDYTSQAQRVSAQAAKAIHYDVLKRDVDTNRQLYGALLQKVKEASVASALAATNVHVMDAAEVPKSPYKPSILSNLLKGIGAGLVLGVLFVVGGDKVNRSLRAPGETPYHLKVPELGVIPACDSVPARPAEGPPRTKATPILLADGDSEPARRVELVTWQDTHSLVAESFRNALASILLSGDEERPRIILVTSASRGEGKSMTVSNLGIGLAELNRKILLVDADMRKPRLHHIFDLSNSWGLSDLLREHTALKDSPVEALARPTQIANLWVLPSGPGTLSISSLLYSTRMGQLLDRLIAEFDTILIDTPPMLALADARVLGRLVDGAILVVRAGQTTRDAALEAKGRLVEDGIPVIGTILNNWDQKSKTRYGNEGYYYYSSPAR